MRLLVSLYIISAATLAATRPVPLAATAAAPAPELETGQRTETGAEESLYSDFIEKEKVLTEELETVQRSNLHKMARAEQNPEVKQGENLEGEQPNVTSEPPYTAEHITNTVPTSSTEDAKKHTLSETNIIIIVVVVVLLCCILIICLPLICLCTGCCGLAISPCLLCAACCGGEDCEGGGCCGGEDGEDGGCCGGCGDFDDD